MSYDKRDIVNALLEIVESTMEKETLTEEQKKLRAKKAAYALNLCTVSVSQIIDYDDITVLEQEYEAILNNLNLQNMPKDQALLNILNHLLDTITYFRIQEGDKKFIDKKYQSKIKNAIWEAVPNLSVLTDWKNPLSIATTVGLSYMNYRRKKAEYILERDYENWQLERAAIDQFNNLQRELFDTSWRLADTYNFDDKYRLTEKQIKQYNEILIDPDAVRRYERLESIQENFSAYPPYWYYYGHAALEIVASDSKKKERKLSNSYRKNLICTAQRSFEFLLADKLYDILREDPIVSACALEYIDTLDVKKDRSKINQLIDRAMEMSGNSYDIWQLCALAYLRIDKVEDACKLLRKLVNENYNADVNAQLLSSIFVKMYVYSGSERLLDDYYLLESRTAGCDLFPLPSERSMEAYDECQKEFLGRKKMSLKEKYGRILIRYMRTCNVEFSQFYTDYVRRGVTRKEEIIEFFNQKVLTCIYELPGVSPTAQSEVLDLVATKMERNAGKFIFADNEKKDAKVGETLLAEIMYPAFNQIGKRISTYIDMAENLSEISEAEERLTKFCEVTRVAAIDSSIPLEARVDSELYLDEEVFGKISERSKKRAEQDKKAKKIVKEYASKVIKTSSEHTKIYINDDSNRIFFDSYFAHSLFYRGDNRYLKQEVIAVIENKEYDDLIITANGVRKRYYSPVSSLSNRVRFNDISWTKNGRELSFETITWKKYANKDVEPGALLAMFKELGANAKENYAESDQKNPFYMLVKI